MELKLPQNLTVRNKEIAVNTDFRHWMDFQNVMSAPELFPWEKINIALYNTFGEIPHESCEDYLNGCIWFIQCGKEPRGEPARERLLDWREDFDTVWADFKLHYHMDIRRVKYLHWWEFMALFTSLPDDAEIKRRIHIRGEDLSKIKDPKLREELRRLKEYYALDAAEEDMDAFYSRML